MQMKPVLKLAMIVAAVVGVLAASNSAAGELNVGFNNGIRSIRFADTELLASGLPAAKNIVLEKREIVDGSLKYEFEDAKLGEPAVSWNANANALTTNTDWGGVGVKYSVEGDRLNMSVIIANGTDRTIADFDIELLRLKFPATPEDLKARGRIVRSLDNLATVTATWGENKVVACVDTIYPPMQFGFTGAADRQRTEFALVLRGGVYTFEEGGVEIYPHGLPRIPAGKTLTINISLRFAPASTSNHEILTDVYKAFGEFYKPGLNWPDRRPIGALFTGGGIGLRAETPEEQEKVRTQMLQYAQTSVRVLKENNAQGCIVWNIEGEENPHPITYIGDPRMLKFLAPAREKVADEFFKIITDAGLRAGVCLRPTQVYLNEERGWQHGTGSHMDARNPLNDDLDKVRPNGLPQWRFFPIVERMSKKIQYCKDRWGVTIFYVDTNGIYVPVGPDNKFEWMLLDAMIWKQIQARHPDVLLIPELRNDNWGFRTAMWAYTAPYEQLDYTKRQSTPEYVRRIYPDAFVSNYIANCKTEDLANWAPGLVNTVRNKDLFMFRGWFACNINPWVRSTYDMAYLLSDKAVEADMEFDALLDAIIKTPGAMLSRDALDYVGGADVEAAVKRLHNAASFFKNARAK